KKLRKLKQRIDEPLAAILSLNTVAHTIGAAGVGAQAQVVFGNAYVTTISVILTLLILVFSEIIPKTIGATYWKGLSSFTARTMGPLIVISYPFVLLSKGLNRLISGGNPHASISREEFSAMAELGFREGIFEEEESNIFKNLIRFESLRIRDIMTPRPVVIRFSEKTPVKSVITDNEPLTVSRIPVYGQEGEEEITGYVLKTEIYRAMAQGGEETPLKELARPIHFVPESSTIKTVLERLLDLQEHIVAVVDEYGGFSGVVTMEDVIETLFGIEIVDEADAIDDMQKLARQKWKERARRLNLPVSEELDFNSRRSDEPDEPDESEEVPENESENR
ncbi:MAG: CNNM domain-containing protein, partial [Bacteroidota bacterium]